MCSISVPVKEELRVPALWFHKEYENGWDVHILGCIEAPNSTPLLVHERRLNSKEFFDFFTRGGSVRELMQQEERRANNPQQKIYLATDNHETQNMFFSLFPKNVIFRKILPKESKEKRHTSIKDATIDLFCLIECKEFYGTKESSFSTFVENYRKNKI